MNPDAVRLTRTIHAPPGDVYRAWTDPARLRRWFGPDGFEVVEVEMDVRPGGRHRTAVAGPPPPENGRKRLEVLIGRWNTEGQTVPGPSEPPTRIAGTDTYEWLGGGFFVVHRVDVRFGDEHVEAIEIIGYDASSGTYPTHAFDSQGSATAYQMRERDGTWTISGETERSTLVPGDDGTAMRAFWERSDDGATWRPWMEIRLTRAAEDRG